MMVVLRAEVEEEDSSNTAHHRRVEEEDSNTRRIQSRNRASEIDNRTVLERRTPIRSALRILRIRIPSSPVRGRHDEDTKRPLRRSTRIIQSHLRLSLALSLLRLQDRREDRQWLVECLLWRRQQRVVSEIDGRRKNNRYSLAGFPLFRARFYCSIHNILIQQPIQSTESSPFETKVFCATFFLVPTSEQMSFLHCCG